MIEGKNRYSDEELVEFKKIIIMKLEKARYSYDSLVSTGNDTDDTSPTFKVMEEGAVTLSKEESGALISRQLKLINNLVGALIRIENKTYGICAKTGKLIQKERLLSVPHATLCIEAKVF